MIANDYKTHDEIAWCPGCGNFGIANAVRKALAQQGLAPKDVLLVSGIGQAAKLPHYVNANCFNGLHGRALPVAVAAKIANPKLTVIVSTGDGDCYGEGGNHFLHNIRRNVNITLLVHDNQIYGLTKGQASPTTEEHYATKVQIHGVVLQPFHPLEAAIALGAGFVARGYSKNTDQLAHLIQAGINHEGFSIIDILQPCVSFNKKNTYEWYGERVYNLEDHDPSDKGEAYVKAAEWGDHIPLGIIYQKPKPTYEQEVGLASHPPLAEQDFRERDMHPYLQSFRAWH